GAPQRAAVSSYGVGGTNSHMIIEQAPPRPAPEPPRRPSQLITLSAKTPTALETASTELAQHVADADQELADIAYTLNVGRPALPVRRVALARDRDHLVEVLGGESGRPPAVTVPSGAHRQVGFLFPGQGAQHVGMGRGLYQSEPAFRDGIDWAAKILAESHNLDVRGLLYPERADDAAAERLSQTAAAQPALFAVEYALVELLREWGVEPGVLAGHSVGEYVAACVSGVMRPEDALRLVADRGALMQELPGGSMIAVMLPEEHLLQLLPPELDVAAVNAPGVCTVSGADEAVRELQEELRARGFLYRPLHTSHAFHSRMMDPILDAFRSRVAAVELSPPRIPFLSNLTGGNITEEQAVDPDYWVRHLRSCVRFSDLLSTLVDAGHVLAEVGPGRTLTSLVAAHTKRAAKPETRPAAVTMLPAPDQKADDAETALLGAGGIWAAGGTVDWKRFWGAQGRSRAPLPGYPYERERFWVEPSPQQGGDAAPEDSGPYYLPLWRESAAPTAEDSAATADDARWVVFAHPGDGCLADLARRLRGAGAQVVVAEPGEAYAADGDLHSLRIGEVEDYARLFQRVAETGPGRVRLVHGWTVGAGPSDMDEVARSRHWLAHGFYSCLTALQVAARVFRGTPVELCVVSTDMQEVTGEGRVDPPKAAVLGLVTTAPREFENLTCHSVDMSLPAESSVLGEQLFAELTAGDHEGQIAYRSWKRWTWSFTGTQPQAPDGVPGLLKARGTYLLTGGLGGLGLVLARQLAEEVNARLVLIGRSGLPGRAEWPALLERGPKGDPTVRRIREVMAVEAAGGEVLVCAGDVADEARMTQIRSEAEAAFGPVDGVFHLAGVAGGGMLETRSREAAEAVLSPKVTGTYVVDKVFQPELFVLYSSIASVTGYFGLGDYNGANAVLDAFAQSRRGSGRHVVSINWPLWTDAGMGTESNAPGILGDLAQNRVTTPVAHPLLVGRHQGDEDAASFEIEMSHDSWVLAEHKLNGTPTIPGTGVVELVRAAYQEVTGEPNAELRDLRLARPLVADSRVGARVELRRRDDGGFDVSVVASAPGAAPQEYARAQVHPLDGDPAGTHDLDACRRACAAEVPMAPPSATAEMPDALITFGRRWDNVASLHSGDGQDLASLSLPEEHVSETADYVLHPALLDTAVGLVQGHRLGGTYLPIGYEKIAVRAPLPARCHSILRYRDDGKGELTRADVTIVDERGVELVAVEGFTMMRVDPKTGTVAAASQAPAATGMAGAGTEMLWPDEAEGAMSNAEGAETLRLVLGSRARPQLLCAPGGLAEKLRQAARVTRGALMEQLSSGAQAGGRSGARNLATPYVEPEPGIERVIAGLWQDGLGVDKVGAEDDFVDLGGDSLVGVQLGDLMNRHFKVEVTIAQLLEARTVRNLAAMVKEAVLQRVSSLSEEEAAQELNRLTKG
ncbi:MAG: SDR family NAD(P)-dependent oxidoreductase, partial [Micromonosporaceae bacterium]|nr:SDR family NAD(P)-dependent oxidoreductase [Micromonosporaceae bacterium]